MIRLPHMLWSWFAQSASRLTKRMQAIPKWRRLAIEWCVLGTLVVSCLFVYPYWMGWMREPPEPRLIQGMTREEVRAEMQAQPQNEYRMWAVMKNGSVQKFVMAVAPTANGEAPVPPQPSLVIVTLGVWSRGNLHVQCTFDDQDRLLYHFSVRNSIVEEFRRLRRQLFGF